MARRKRSFRYEVQPIAEFVRAVLDECGLTANAFSRAANIPDSNIYDLLAAKHKPSFELMQHLALHLSRVSGLNITLDIFDRLSRGELSLDKAQKSLKKSSPSTTMQGKSTISKPMSELPGSGEFISLIASLLSKLLGETELDQAAVAHELGISLERLKELMETRTEIDLDEYGAIADLLNQHKKLFNETIWDAESLKASRESIDRDTGIKLNGNGAR